MQLQITIGEDVYVLRELTMKEFKEARKASMDDKEDFVFEMLKRSIISVNGKTDYDFDSIRFNHADILTAKYNEEVGRAGESVKLEKIY